MNNVILIGRLVKDIELRYTSNGVATASFTIAVTRPFKNASGEKESDFINVVAWRGQAENAANYLRKGSQCALSGSIQTRNYENKEGQKVYVTEVVADRIQFLDSKQSTGATPPPKQNNLNNDPFANDGKNVDISDDDLPF